MTTYYGQVMSVNIHGRKIQDIKYYGNPFQLSCSKLASGELCFLMLSEIGNFLWNTSCHLLMYNIWGLEYWKSLEFPQRCFLDLKTLALLNF
jgi:hypothetical protein